MLGANLSPKSMCITDPLAQDQDHPDPPLISLNPKGRLIPGISGQAKKRPQGLAAGFQAARAQSSPQWEVVYGQPHKVTQDRAEAPLAAPSMLNHFPRPTQWASHVCLFPLRGPGQDGGRLT